PLCSRMAARYSASSVLSMAGSVMRTPHGDTHTLRSWRTYCPRWNSLIMSLAPCPDLSPGQLSASVKYVTQPGAVARCGVDGIDAAAMDELFSGGHDAASRTWNVFTGIVPLFAAAS